MNSKYVNHIIREDYVTLSLAAQQAQPENIAKQREYIEKNAAGDKKAQFILLH